MSPLILITSREYRSLDQAESGPYTHLFDWLVTDQVMTSNIAHFSPRAGPLGEQACIACLHPSLFSEMVFNRIGHIGAKLMGHRQETL